jgi:hypothetical protein
MSDEQKFTPGPWTLETVRTSVGVCHKIGRLGSSTKLNHACLYDDCYSAEPRDLQLLADARLIAAAPELYEALEVLVDSIAERYPMLRDLKNDKHLTVSGLGAAFVIAEQALAKVSVPATAAK